MHRKILKYFYGKVLIVVLKVGVIFLLQSYAHTKRLVT